MEIFFISLLSLALIGIGFFAITQYFNFKKEKSKWESLTEEKIRQVKSDSTEYIRQTVDKIASVPQEYANKSDREVLLNIILALDTYGRRIDRLDDKLDGIYNYKTYIDSMNSQIQKTTEYFVALNEKTIELDNIFTICKSTLQKVSNEFETINKHFSNTINTEQIIKKSIDLLNEYAPTLYSISYQVQQIQNEIDSINKHFTDTIKLKQIIEKSIDLLNECAPTLYSTSYQVQQIQSTISTFNKNFSNTAEINSSIKNNIDLLNEYTPILYSTSYQVHQIQNEIEKIISTYDTSPARKLENIEQTSEKTLQLLNAIKSNIDDYNDLVSDIKFDVSSVRSNVSDMKSNIDEYSDLHSDINKIKEAVVGRYYSYDTLHDIVSDIKSDVSDVKSDMWYVKSDVSDVKSDVSSIKSNIS